MNQDIEMHSGDGSDGVRHDSAVVRRPANAHAPIVARRAVNIRAGTMADLPLIDRMQKAHSRELGFLPTKPL